MKLTLFTERDGKHLFYCLPVTQFTETQCKHIQSQVYKNLIPKMGYNYHTPHAVLFEPHKFGGAQLDSYYTIQHICHIENFIRYIQQDHSIGQLYLNYLSQYQLFIGSETPLLMQSSSQFSYGEICMIQYMWDACSSIHTQHIYYGYLHCTTL